MRPHPLLLSILAVLPGCGETFVTEGCIEVDEGTTTCPAPDSVSLDDVFLTQECDVEKLDIKGSGELSSDGAMGLKGSFCCYPVEVYDEDPSGQCNIGRPYIDRDQAQRAAIVNEHGQTLDTSEAHTGSRARAWALAGSAEHASVAAFNRLSLQLLALGAPLELLGDVQRAAMEEVQHAHACFELARELGAPGLTLGEFPFAGPVDPHVDLAALAYAAVREGCLAETLGAAVVSSVAERVTEHRLQAVLRRLAQEESQHAVLSFRIVAWALATGGQTVRDAVAKALNEPWPTLDISELALRTGLAPSIVQDANADAYQRVLTPANRALAASC